MRSLTVCLVFIFFGALTANATIETSGDEKEVGMEGATDSNSASESSDEASGMPPVLEAPLDLHIRKINNTRVRLRWERANNEAEGFKILRTYKLEDPWVEIDQVGATDRVYTDSLGVDTTAYYVVRAFKGAETADSDLEFGTTANFSGAGLRHGNNDFMEINGPLLSTTDGMQPFTIEGWLRIKPDVPQGVLFSQYLQEGPADPNRLEITKDAAGVLRVEKGGTIMVQTTGEIDDDLWHHYGIVKKANGLYAIYIDNVLDSEGAIADTSPFSNTPSLIGARKRDSAPQRFLRADFDEFRIWNIEKTNFNDRFRRPVYDNPDLLAYYAFDEKYGTDVIDRSINANNAQLIGTPRWINRSRLNDLAPPVVVTIDPVGPTNDPTPALSGTLTGLTQLDIDLGTNVRIVVNGKGRNASLENGNTRWTLPDNFIDPLPSGTYDVIARVSIDGDNMFTDSSLDEVVIDLDAPTVSVDALATNNQTPGLSGRVDDNSATISVRVAGSNYGATNNGDGTWILANDRVSTLAAGTYDVLVTATDLAGNSDTDDTSGELTIDLRAPVVSLASLSTRDRTPQLTGTVDDNDAAIIVNLDGHNYSAANNRDGSWTLADNAVATLREGLYEVMVTATDLAGNAGVDGTSNELTVDLTAPLVEVNTLVTNDQTPELTGSVDDHAATISVNIGGNDYGATNNADGTWTLPDDAIGALAAGDYNVTVTATDAVGNASTDATTNELTIDLTAPAVSVSILATNDQTPELSGSVDDNTATISVNVQGTDYSANNNGDGTWTLADDVVASLGAGNYSVEATATDEAGNSSIDATNNELTIDLTAPTVGITPLSTGDTSPEMSGSVDDNDAVVVIDIEGDKYTATNNGNGSWTLADNTILALAPGTYDVIATATDPAGNVGTDGSTDELIVDVTAPVVTMTVLITNDQTPELSGTVDDNTASINVNVGGNDYAATNNGNGTWTLADNTITTLAADVYNVTVTATDDQSNAGTDDSIDELTIDITAPSITVTSLTTNDQTPALTGTLDDNSAVINVRVQGADYTATNNGDGTWILPNNTVTSLIGGTYDVTATATDEAGNEGSDATTDELIIDLMAPNVTVELLTTSDQTPGLSGTVDDNTATINVNVNSNDYPAVNNMDGTWTLADDVIAELPEGVYEVVVTAADGGNVGTDGTTKELTIDLTAPTVTIDLLTTNDDQPELTGEVDESNATINVRVNGADYPAVNAGDGTWVLPAGDIAALPENDYEVIVTATDGAGNAGTDVTTNELTIDLTAPNVDVDRLITNDRQPELTGPVDDNTASIRVNVAGNDYTAINNGDGTWTLPDNISSTLGAGTYSIVVNATDLAGNIGSGTEDLTIDLTTPIIVVDPLITKDRTPQLSGAVDDNTADINVRVDGNDYPAVNNGDGTWTLADGAVSTLAEGLYNVEATATDEAGNEGTDGSTNELNVDITAPIVTITSITTKDQTPELVGTIDDNDATINLRIDGNDYSAVNNGDGSWTLADDVVATLAEGTYNVELTATDVAANDGTDATTNEVIIDLTAPTVGITSLITKDQTPQLVGLVNDNTAVVSVEVAGDDYSANNNGDGTWTLADNSIVALAAGTYDIAVTATDIAQNAGTDVTADELQIDLTAPVVTVNESLTNDETPLLTGTVDDNTAAINVNVGGNDYTATNNGNGSWTLPDNRVSALGEGVASVVVTATDEAGNSAVDGTSDELTIDLTAPVVTIAPLQTNDQSPSLSGTIDDHEAILNVNIDGNDYSAANNGDGSWVLADNIIATLGEGTFEVTMTATDLANNDGTDGTSSEVLIDLTEPIVSVTALTTNDQTPELSGTVNDNAATIKVMVDDNDYVATNNGDGTWSLADDIVLALGDGTYDVAVTATDPTNNSGVDGTSNELTVDIIAPSVSLDLLTTNDQTPALTGTVDDVAASVEVTVDGNNYSALNNADGTWTLADDVVTNLLEGTYDVGIKATDLVGNVGLDDTADELVVDVTAPVVSVTSETTNDNTPELTGTVDDNDAVINVNVAGTDYTATNNGDGTWTLSDNSVGALLAAKYDVQVTATDVAGNAGTDGTSDELTVDLTAPTVEVNPLVTNDQSPELTGTVDDNVAVIKVNLDGVDYDAANNGDGTWTLPDDTVPLLPDGVYGVVVLATDIAGNVGTDATSDELTIDLVPPTLTINALATNDPTPQLTGTVDDPTATIDVTVEGTDYVAANNGDGTWTLADDAISPLADGIYDVTATGTDPVGNEASDATADELEVDTVVPVVTIDEISTLDLTPKLTGTISETDAAVSVSIDGTSYAATNVGDGTWIIPDNTISGVEGGTYDAIVTATDPAGNVGTDTSTDELVLLTPEEIPTVSVTPLETEDLTPAIFGEINDPTATIEVTIDAQVYLATNNEDGTWTLEDDVIGELAVGVYDVAIAATSGNGLVGNDNTGDELRILPAPTRVPESSDITFSSFSIAWEAMSGGAVEYELNVGRDPAFIELVPGFEAVKTTETSLAVTGLSYATPYFCRVRVTYASGDVSPFSETLVAKTIYAPGTLADSSALANIYAMTKGAEWTIQDGWAVERIEDWHGVTMEAARVTIIDLSGNNLQDTFPASQEGLEEVIALNLGANSLKEVEDVTGLESLELLDISANNLQFGTLERLVGQVPQVLYLNQGPVLETVPTLEEKGTTYTFDREVTGTNNAYRWFKDGELIAVDQVTISVDVEDFAQEGDYYAEVTNSQFPDLVLTTNPIVLKVSSLERDREALRIIYAATDGPNWSNGADWANNPNVDTWIGVTVSDNRVTELDLAGANVTGNIPEDIVDIVALQFLDLSNNEITGLPDLRSLTELVAPDVSNNRLDFDDLEHNVQITSLKYSGQAPFGSEQEIKVPLGTPYEISFDVGGSKNDYHWILKGRDAAREIADAHNDSYQISAVDYGTMGDYTMTVESPLVPGLLLTSQPQKVLATVDIEFAPTYLDIDNEVATLDEGESSLLRIIGPGVPFDSVETVNVTSEGILFEDVVLGDYVIGVRTDTLILKEKNGQVDSVKLLPTYYRGTFLWEEADTLFLREPVKEDLVMQQRPRVVDVGENEIQLTG